MSDPASGAALPRHFYDRDGQVFLPTQLAVSPWDAGSQNGLALSGLVAHLAEQTPTSGPMMVMRLVLDIMYPTPLSAIEARVNVAREGRRLQLLEIHLMSGKRCTARATVLRMRLGSSPPAAGMNAPSAPPPGGRAFLPRHSRTRHIIETRLVSGGLDEWGPGSTWSRIGGEIVRGAAITPLVHAAILADFGSGLSTQLNWREWSFANVDVSLHLSRLPQGEWLRLDAETLAAGNGIALVDGQLADVYGPIGRTHQTLYIDRNTNPETDIGGSAVRAPLTTAPKAS